MLFRNKLFFAFVALFCAVGVYIAYVMVDQYESIVDGVLGIVVLYFVYLVFVSPKRIIKESVEIHLEFPRDFKYPVFGLFFTIIMFWAGVQIIDLIWYLIRILRISS
jgi:hypothetical protein